MMMLGERSQNVVGDYYRKEDINNVLDVEDNSDTHSNSSEVFSDDARETGSTRSSVTSPGSPIDPDTLSSASRYCPTTQPSEWQTGQFESTPCKTLPSEQRQNPRRTSNAGECKQPPSLVRQSERKECFVACLVTFAAQFVEAIWPLAACTPRSDASFNGRGVLSLQSFITETLRRSRTSYSTLQVALFYLVLIKDLVPRINFTMEQPRGNDEFRAMQCGRRMFLTALILASKYLQDRNYSTRAWSKISGLRAQEIHLNEMEYCKKIQWTLHVPKEKFDRWSFTVLKLSSPIGKGSCDTVAKIIGWSKVLGKLDRDLTEVFPTREDFTSCPPLSMFMPTNFVFGESSPERRSINTSSNAIPNDLSDKSTPVPPQTAIISQPPQPRIDNLPTPQSTPHPNPFNTFTNMVGTPSICAAMSQVRNQGLVRVTRDNCPPPQPCLAKWGGSRSSSLARTVSAASSPPESVISEPPALIHSRNSRSSSISSSVSSVSAASLPPRLGRCAPSRAALAREGAMPIDSMLCRSSQTSDMSFQKMLSDLDTRSISPESWDQRSTGSDPDRTENVTVWSKAPNAYNMKDFKAQDWEAAEALCKLPSQPTPPSWNNTPKAYQFPALSRSISADDGSQLTPRPNARKGVSSENVSPTCHKRTHSKTSEPTSLQDSVRGMLMADLPDRSRAIPCQSPGQSCFEKKQPIPTLASDGHKRQCANRPTFQYPAAVCGATELLRSGMRRGVCRS